MQRLRIVMTNEVPSDHLLDVENLPVSFWDKLERVSREAWFNKEKEERLVEYKSNRWDEFEVFVKQYASGVMPKPAKLVQGVDSRLAPILPPNISESQIPSLKMNTPSELLEIKEKLPIQHTYMCPHCGFVGKSQFDIEGHLSGVHGMDVNLLKQQAGIKVETVQKEEKPPLPAVEKRVYISEDGMEFDTREGLLAHRESLRSETRPVAAQDGGHGYACRKCSFTTKNLSQFRGHIMTAHRKEKVNAV